MTYNVFGGTLNPAQSNLVLRAERLEFGVKPRDASLSPGSDVTLACSAPGASLSWRRVGVAELPGHVTSSVDGRLRLRGVRPSDAGLYVCTAQSADHSQTVDATIRIDVTGQHRHWGGRGQWRANSLRRKILSVTCLYTQTNM